MARLHFGFTDAPYEYGPARNTHQVADYLEAKYGVVERFVTDSESEIRALVREQSERHARNIVKGRPPNMRPMLDKIKLDFKSYILRRALDGRPGIPTLASLRGVKHGLKHPYAKRASRPSFFDTGLYVKNFKAWVE